MALWTVREDGKWWNGEIPRDADVEEPPVESGDWSVAYASGWASTGVTLNPTPWTSPTTLSGTQTIDSRTMVGDFQVAAGANITITRSQINGRLDCDGGSRHLTLEDCNVNASTVQAAAVGFGDLTIVRCNIIGGANSIIGGSNITIIDSWLHDQYLGPTAGDHENAFICNGGSNIIIQNCVLHADEPDNGHDGGVSTNCSIFGDFEPVFDITIEGCLIKATPGAYGVSLGYNPQKPYGSDPANIVFRNNTFERGTSGHNAVYGPVTAFLNANGNVFTGNVWEDDGTPVSAS